MLEICKANEPYDRIIWANDLCKKHDTMKRKYNRTHKIRARYILGRKGFDRYVAKRYGITAEVYKQLVQKPCQICGRTSTPRIIDHDHNKLGPYRGVLCNGCNSALGWYEQRLDTIKEYLECQ